MADEQPRPAVAGPLDQPVGRPVPEREELSAALDTSGSVVLVNAAGDIVFYAADGKMKVHRRGKECDACTAANLRLAEAVAGAWNESQK